MGKAHKDFLELTHTKGDARLWFTHNDKYKVILQLYVNVNSEWQDARLLYRSSSFVEANAVWVHLTNQDHRVWRRTQYNLLA